MSRIKELHGEFVQLRDDLFGKDKFVIEDDNDPRWARYSQLLAYFHSGFRTKDWVNPETESNTTRP